MGGHIKPDLGLLQPALGQEIGLTSWLMAKKRGRPPKQPVYLPPGAFRDLRDNSRALLTHLFARPDESWTDTLRAFADKYDVGYGTLQRMTDGLAKPRFDSLEKFSAAFAITVPQLFIAGEATRIIDARRKRRETSDDDESRLLQRDGGTGSAHGVDSPSS